MILSEICIKRPVFATVLSLVIVVVGAVFFNKLQIRGIPDIDPPVINIQSTYEGADALYMEREITTRIEKVLKTVKNVDFITSTSSVGESTITILFKLSTDIEVALNDVRSKISDISNIFPEDMKPPSVSKQSSDAQPSLWISVDSDRFNKIELTRIMQDLLKDPLERLNTVGRAQTYGGEFYTMRIEPDPVKMFQHKISPLEIATAVRNQNKNYPAGIIKTENKNFTLRFNAALKKPEEFGNIILRVTDGEILKLKDVAAVYLASLEEDVLLRYSGNRAIAIGLVKQSKSNIIDLSKEVRSELERLKKNLPGGIKVEIAYDAAIPVNASIKGVFKTIIEALILVILVTYLFLGSVKVTIIPAVTIPVSLIGTFSVMYLMGFSINTFTLLAMILAIGLVVDDAIVMLENIFRHHENGETSMQAAFLAVNEISFAIIAMTITLAAVFFPIGFIEGFLGKLFVEFAWTLAFCVLFSGFIALTLTPMMASRMVTSSHNQLPGFLNKFEQGLKFIQEKYVYYLDLAFDNKKKFFLLSSSSIFILILSFTFVNKAFVPEEDEGFLQVVFSGPQGSSVKQSEKTVVVAEQILSTYKDILGYFSVIGWGGGDSAFAFVPLKDWSIRHKSQEQLRNELNQQFSALPGMTIFAMAPRSLASGGAAHPIEFNLQSSMEYPELDKLSTEFIDQLKQNPVFENVDRDFKSSNPTLDIVVNREKAYLYGVNLETIGVTIQYLVAGTRIGDFQLGNDNYEVTLRYNREDRSYVNDVKQILVKNNKNILLPLEVVANVIEKITVKSYGHYNNSRSISITSDLNPNYKVTDAVRAIDKIAEKLVNHASTKLEYVGEIQRMKESDNSLVVTFLFAIIFIYLVLAAQFESFADPLLIVLAVPFSITGGVLALLICGNTINMYSNIGLITLIGLITKNAIMIVEFANQLRASGLNVREAVSKSAHLRLRPILMTTMATICGAIPLVLASGAGAGARNSIGLVIVGGMFIGTAFTLFVIPVLYQTFKRA